MLLKSIEGLGHSSVVDRMTYKHVAGLNPRPALPGKAIKTWSGYDHSSCPDDKPKTFFLEKEWVLIYQKK